MQVQEIIHDAIRNNLRKINLGRLGLSEVPKSMLDISELEELSLYDNKLTRLPDTLINLKNLRIINLFNNEFTEIPEVIFELPNLDTLIIAANPILSINPKIRYLKNLHRLSIAQTELEEIPEEIGDIKSLHTLNISCPLGDGKILSLPPGIGKLSNLLVLYLGGNRIKILPKEISSLKNLIFLDLSGNALDVFPSVITELTDLQALDLGGNVLYGYNQIKELPADISSLKKMRNLNLSHNILRSLPAEFYNLDCLEVLNLRSNEIVVLSNEIIRMKNLVHLCVDQNLLEKLPATIGDIEKLRFLEAQNNELIALPQSIERAKNLKELCISGNNLSIPSEILEKTSEPFEIINYYFKTLTSKLRSLNEVKLNFVGEGGVGKTSLVNRLIEVDFNPRENKTDGISIYYSILVDEADNQKSNIKLNIWDFGGQEILHATHQFFLTKRSLYLLVLDSRLTQEENRVEYWLKIIQSFGGESPVLIVGNKIDQHPLDIDRTGLQKKYPNIVGIFETSAATGSGIEELKAAITEQVNNLPHVRDLLPETWFAVKTKLEELGRESNFITHDKYLELCAENEVSDETSQRTLIGFLHDLGVVLHFQDDPRLESLGILNPQWVTNGVYKILNSHDLFQNKGVLTVSMLDEILNLPEYPRGKRLFIVDMMKKFELCYDIEADKTFLVPDLLPKDQPDLKFNGIPAFEYAYPVLPSSVITRFIVRMNQHIDDGLVWRAGVVLKIGENRALVKADIEDRKITIAIDGLEHTRRDALSAIRYQLDEIHATIKGLNPQKMVPIPDAPNAEPLEYETLLMLEREGQAEYLVRDGNRLVKVNVREILSGIESESQRKETGGNVTNIYVGGDMKGSNIISGNNNVVTQKIQNSFNKAESADIQAELKETLKQLVAAVGTMNKALPAEQAEEVADDLGKLVEEATKPKPNKKWYSVSIDGLIKAAENLDKLGEPVINLSKKVLSLLTGGVIGG